MKKHTLRFTILSILLATVLSACGAVQAVVPQEVSGLLNGPQNASSQAQPESANAPQNIAQQAAPAAPANQAAPSAGVVQPGLLAAYEDTLVQIYEQVNPSVVNIRVVQQIDASQLNGGNMPFNFPAVPGSGQGEGETPLPDLPQYGEGAGSGFVWDQQGHIVTNNHVVENADKIEVTFADGTSVPAELVGADEYSDLAVLKVDMPTAQLKPIQLADYEQVKVGQLAVAIGNPFGLEGTMTLGIVSALGRSIPASESNIGPTYTIPDIIQTDAPINPGNSGGVLLNDAGELIGVTTAIESSVGGNVGIGYAIPSTIVQRVVPSLIDTGRYQHSYLGISGTSLTSDLARAMNLDANQRGALVGEVMAKGPADKAGLRGSNDTAAIDGQQASVGGDVIIAIDGAEIRGMDDLIAYLTGHTQVGQTVTITVLRDGKQMDVEVALSARPGESAPQAASSQETQPDNQPTQAYLGIAGTDLTDQQAEEMQLPAGQPGILVAQVEPGSPADQAGLQSGDVITALDGQMVRSIRELAGSLTQYQPGQEVTLTVLRNGEQMDIKVTLGERPTEN